MVRLPRKGGGKETAGMSQPWGQASCWALCAARPARASWGTGASGRHPPEQAEASSRCLPTWLRLGSPSPPGLAAPAIQFIKGVTAKIHLKMKKMQANPFWETLID